MADHDGDYQPLVDAVKARWMGRQVDLDFVAYEVRKWAEVLEKAGFVIVRTNDMVPTGLYDLDTSADGFYLNPLDAREADDAR